MRRVCKRFEGYSVADFRSTAENSVRNVGPRYTEQVYELGLQKGTSNDWRLAVYSSFH